MRCAATVPASIVPAAISRCPGSRPRPRRWTRPSPEGTQRLGDQPERQAEAPAPWDHRPGRTGGVRPKPIRRTTSRARSRLDRSANSSMVRPSSRRWIEARTSGTASEMKPGLTPVLWIEVPPCRQAPSTGRAGRGPCCRGGGTRPGSSRRSIPDSSSRHTSSKSHALWHVQDAVRREREDLADYLVGEHPDGAEPTELPGISRPCPASTRRARPASGLGCSITSRRERAPMLPVAHCTTRCSRSFTLQRPPRAVAAASSSLSGPTRQPWATTPGSGQPEGVTQRLTGIALTEHARRWSSGTTSRTMSS